MITTTELKTAAAILNGDDDADDVNEDACPDCGTDLEAGICPECGDEANDSDAGDSSEGKDGDDGWIE